MPDPNIDINVSLVRRLVAGQFPQWAHLPIRPVDDDGWDNRSFRLGENMTIRLPSSQAYAPQVEKEHRWLPRLAPLLPLPVPEPLAIGCPAQDYPWLWSVYRWLEGEIATLAPIADLNQFATTLAQFLAALQQTDPTGGPPPGPQNFYRGGSLAVYDTETRAAIAALHGKVDTEATTAVWKAALRAVWHGPPVWLHGDVSPTNLLVKNGRLCAVIDFGCSAVGDPACDLAIAWTFFSGESREAFRHALPLDNGTWARGRGWALWKALIILADHAETTSLEARTARRALDELLADHQFAKI